MIETILDMAETDRYVNVTSREIHHSIKGTVGDSDLSGLLTDLREGQPTDVIYLHINTLGGSLDTCLEVIHGIETTQATVIGVAEGAVVSAGSIIFFACHGFIVNPLAYFMIHDGSTGAIGKINENLKSAQFDDKHTKMLYKKVYGGFFTKKEIKKVLAGEDMYLLADEVTERIRKVLEENNNSDKDSSGEGQITDGAGI